VRAPSTRRRTRRASECFAPVIRMTMPIIAPLVTRPSAATASQQVFFRLAGYLVREQVWCQQHVSCCVCLGTC
jgi:hypothetical protein